MFKILLSFALLSLTSCMKLNLKEKSKSDKGGYVSGGTSGAIITSINLFTMDKFGIKAKSKE